MDEIQRTENSTAIVDDNYLEDRIQILEEVVRKEYLNRINEMVIAPTGELINLEEDIIDNVRLYKITEMVYQKGELVTDKFTTVFNTLSSYATNVFIVMDSDGLNTDYYVGVRNMEVGNQKRSTVTIGDTLKNTLIGQFPGIKIDNEDRKGIALISNKINEQTNVASVSVLGSDKIKDIKDNEQFVQGIEKLAYAMNGRQYIGILIAETKSPDTIHEMRSDLQHLHSDLFPYKSYQLAENESISRKKRFGEMDKSSKALTIADTVCTALPSVLSAAGTVVGGAVGSAAYGVGAVPGAMVGNAMGTVVGTGISAVVKLAVPKESITKGSTTTQNYENKMVADLIELIDEEIKRTKEFDCYGMWDVAGYFLSKDMSTAEIAASNYRSLMNGEKTGFEISAINSWRKTDDLLNGSFADLTTYLSRFVHPRFLYGEKDGYYIYTTASTAVSGKELGLHLGLPRKTVSGMPVIEHAEFGKEVISSSLFKNSKLLRPEDRMTIGKVYDLGKITDKAVELDNNSLTMHTFITGSTGSGKSNTVYQILNELYVDKIPFLVIEPAKGEYKDVFGNWDDVHVYSTNPKIAELININPFMFPDSIHVLEHIDGLIEIFSVCWPMYDAMPAFFKDAILESYEEVGWDLGTSTFDGNKVEYPDFSIVYDKLDELIEESDYASDVKSNYRGALLTRVKSLTIGLNKYIFTNSQTPYYKLFDENCILDLSRVKSAETRSLLMGLMVYILNEYRLDNKTSNNEKLKHITVLEEAHNLLKNTSGEDKSVVGKSVEMLTQTIAEIRTCGEGFVIVDQSPSSVDISAIKNTNTKIVLRTPEGNDRDALGKSMGLTEEQTNEIAKLPGGVAVVYQNDWVSPVLTMVDKADINEREYINNLSSNIMTEKTIKSKMLRFILDPWIEHEQYSKTKLMCLLNGLMLRRREKKLIEQLIVQYFDNGGYIEWTGDDFAVISKLVRAILALPCDKIVKFDEAETLKKYIDTITVNFTYEEINTIGYFATWGGEL